MSIRMNIGPSLSEAAGANAAVEVSGTDVGQCLSQLVDRFPGLRTRLFDADGALKSYVEIYVNQKSAYPRELARAVEDGDEIQIVEAIAGGC